MTSPAKNSRFDPASAGSPARREPALIGSPQRLRGEAHGLIHDPVHFTKPQQRLLATPRPATTGGASHGLRLRFQGEFQLAAKLLFHLHTATD